MCILIVQFHLHGISTISDLYLCRYVDVILQLIDKAGDFVSDDIWYRVVQFVTNNEDLQVCIYLVAKNLINFVW